MNNPFDWESFSQKLREQLPDMDVNTSKPEKMDFSWIQETVEKALDHSLGLSPKPTTKQANRESSSAYKTASDDAGDKRYHLKPKMMQTMSEVIVRIDVPEGLNAKRIRIESSAHRMHIRVLPQQQPQTIAFPVKVQVNHAKAVCRQDVIEIRLPKHSQNEPFRPIPIRYER